MPESRVISVNIPSLNAAGTFRECLDSVMSQDFRNFEIIVVDGGSGDTTVEIAREFDASVIVARHLRLLGQRHLAASRSKGEFCLLLDADQVLAPDALGRLAGDFANKDMVILGERSYHPRRILPKLADMDRKLAQGDLGRQIDPWRGMIHPRFYRRSILVRAFDRIPGHLENRHNNWADALLYYEATKLTSSLGYLPDAVFHQDREGWGEFFGHYLQYGKNLRNLMLPDEYRELISSRMRGRLLIGRRELNFRDRIASTIYVGLKAMPHSLGYWLG